MEKVTKENWGISITILIALGKVVADQHTESREKNWPTGRLIDQKMGLTTYSRI